MPTWGATGRFPRGKVHASDQGELRMGVTSENGTIFLRFGKPTAWLGFGPAEARDLAGLLNRHADELELDGRPEA